jgi:hypothetical protein
MVPPNGVKWNLISLPERNSSALDVAKSSRVKRN